VPDRTTPKPRPPARSAPAKGRPPSLLWVGLFVVVLIAGVVAVVTSRGSDDDGTTVAGDNGTTGSTQLAAQETRPVEVSGTPIPRFDARSDTGAGMVIPTVEGASFDGTPVTIMPDGRPKVIVFVAHWCPHCQREVPRLSEYLRENPLPGDVDMVTVATGTTPDRPNYPPSAWLERETWPGPVLADSEDATAASAFGLSSYPFFVAADKDGKIVARTSGELTTDQFAELVRLARG
jgi:cytochrome c biogenesis protein CcmG, thiol:disulfide interchange protein DsbE